MSDTGKFAVSLISAPPWVRDNARAWMARRGKPDVVAALIMALRYVPGDRAKNTGVLKAITGANYGPDWNDWMLWQQAHPEVKSFEGFDRFQADLFARIDPNFRVFLRPGVKHEIRLEEIVWGGVRERTCESLGIHGEDSSRRPGIALDEVKPAVVGAHPVERDVPVVAQVLDDLARERERLGLFDGFEYDPPGVLDGERVTVRAVR